MTSDERKVIAALAILPNTEQGVWMTGEQLKLAVALKFPELVSMSTSKLGLTLAKHRLWKQRRHTVAGKLVLLDYQRLAALAAQPIARP